MIIHKINNLFKINCFLNNDVKSINLGRDLRLVKYKQNITIEMQTIYLKNIQNVVLEFVDNRRCFRMNGFCWGNTLNNRFLYVGVNSLSENKSDAIENLNNKISSIKKEINQ